MSTVRASVRRTKTGKLVRVKSYSRGGGGGGSSSIPRTARYAKARKGRTQRSGGGHRQTAQTHGSPIRKTRMAVRGQMGRTLSDGQSREALAFLARRQQRKKTRRPVRKTR